MLTNSRYLINEFLRENLVKNIKKTSSTNILDVGCGRNPYKKYFDSNKNYIGIDKRSLTAHVRGVGEFMPFKGSFFDTILCTQVLEHVEDPPKVLRELNRLLVCDGVLILSTHGFWIEGHEKTDYWRWTLQGLVRIFEDSAFEIISTDSMDPFPSFFQFLSLFIPSNGFGKPIQVVINLLSGIFSRLFGHRGPNVPAVHVIYAKKKSPIAEFLNQETQ